LSVFASAVVLESD